jgi:hypothetical protein
MKKWNFVSLIALIGCIGFNYIAVALPIGSQRIVEISEKYFTYLTPMRHTFGLWSVIYVLLVFYAIYAFSYSLLSPEVSIEPDKVAPAFTLSCLLNSAWIFSAHYNYLAVSILIIFLLVFCLVYIYLKLNIHYHDRLNFETFLVRVPFSIYLGWTSLAAVLNVSVFLVSRGITFGDKEPLVAIGVLSLIAFLAWLVAILRNDYFFDLAVAWGVLGIYLNQIERQILYPDKQEILSQLAPITLKIFLVIVAAAIFCMIRSFSKLINHEEIFPA